jgi:hypothetical protein
MAYRMVGSLASRRSSCEGREGDAGWLCQLAIGEQAEYRRSRVDGQGATIEETNRNKDCQAGRRSSPEQ